MIPRKRIQQKKMRIEDRHDGETIKVISYATD